MSLNKSKNLPLRLGVGIVLLNHENNIFVGKRIDNPKNSWQMPQGGVDQNENFLQAAKRELEEETGIKSVKLIKELEGWFKYDLPKYLLGKTDEINVKTKNPEFFEWKWIKPSELPEVAVNFKLDIYKKIKEELSSLNIN